MILTTKDKHLSNICTELQNRVAKIESLSNISLNVAVVDKFSHPEINTRLPDNPAAFWIESMEIELVKSVIEMPHNDQLAIIMHEVGEAFVEINQIPQLRNKTTSTNLPKDILVDKLVCEWGFDKEIVEARRKSSYGPEYASILKEWRDEESYVKQMTNWIFTRIVGAKKKPMIQIQIFCPKCGAELSCLLPSSGPLKLICSSCGADCGESTPLSGFLYALKNESMPGLLKIGFTTRSIEERVAEFGSSTATPTPFEIVFYFACSDPQSDEVLAHEVLGKYRLNQDREFFKIDVAEALRILRAKLGRRESFLSTGAGATSYGTADSLMNEVLVGLRENWKTTAGACKAISLIYRLISKSKYSEAKKVLDLFLIDNPDHAVARKQLLRVEQAIENNRN